VLLLTNSSVTYKIYIIAPNLRLSVTAPLSFGADMVNHTQDERQTSKIKDSNTEHVQTQSPQHVHTLQRPNKKTAIAARRGRTRMRREEVENILEIMQLVMCR